MAWIENVRLALLISLSVLVVALLWRRFKRNVVARDLPVALHAELLSLEVMYHPVRLRVEVSMPEMQELRPAMLAADHALVHDWPAVKAGGGISVVELPINGQPDGEYYLRLATHSQSTVRRFTLRQA